MAHPEELRRIIQSGRRLVIYLHDSPDPDAMAAGWLLKNLAEAAGVQARIVYGGRLGRAENRAMVSLLKIPLVPLDRRSFRHLRTDRYALVDTQPHAGNNAFPAGRRAHIVIDHHPPRPDLDADLVDIRPGGGCSTTLVLEYHQGAGLALDPDLATAAAYAIISETQDLEREAARADREAYQLLFPLVRQIVLGRIRHPPREREYYRTIARAMRHALLAKNATVCHIGQVPYPEVVAEVADFLVAMKRITWCLVTGHQAGAATLSIRTTHPDGQAGTIMRAILEDLGRGGGHGMMAGGGMPCKDDGAYRELTPILTRRFFKRIGGRSPRHPRPLLEEEGGPGSDDPRSRGR